MPDHAHMMTPIPLKYSVSQVVGLYQRKKCDPYSTELLRKEAGLCRTFALGTGLLCYDGRSR